MLLLLSGFAILCGLLLLGYLFLNTDPAKLARVLKWAGIAIAVVAVLALAVSGRLALLLMPLAMALPLFGRLRRMLGRFRGPPPGSSSDVETPFLRMHLDHETGAMTGTILRGRFAGMRLDELAPAEWLALLRECRAGDEDGARLLEAYLDRAYPAWRDELGGERAGATPPSRGTAALSVAEAYAILGLAPGADAEAIRAAHHRLMKQLHPDHGGSDYLATQINRARDVLLGR